jgi:hypothetical protein
VLEFDNEISVLNVGELARLARLILAHIVPLRRKIGCEGRLLFAGEPPELPMELRRFLKIMMRSHYC